MSQLRPRGRGWVLVLASALGCAIGTGDDGFDSSNTLGVGSQTQGAETETEAGGEAEGPGESGMADGSATSIGEPPDDTEGPPPGSEICNGFDDDGDGAIDEDQPMITCGVGSCEVTEPSCVGGMPQVCTPALPGSEVCNGLDDDCDGTVDNDSDQSCSTACGSGVMACVGGVEQACDAPPAQAESCNLDDDDCDGSIDEGVGGCRVGVHRSYNPNTGEHFYTSNLGESQCCGFNLEFADYYHLYAGPQPGLVAFYRCLKGNGLHFYTQSATCEGQTVEGVLGYIATASGVAGSAPLYRLYRGVSGDHFYTTSANERDNAVANSGYAYEFIAGYVW